MQRLRFLVWKEFLELRQNPRLFGIVIVAPIIQLTMLGYAATTDVRDVPVVVADGDRSRASRELIARFEGSPNFTIIDTVTTVDSVEPYLERGRAWMALSIPAGYAQAVDSRRPVTIQVIADGTDSNSTTVALGYATSLVGGYAQELIASATPGGTAPPGGIESRIRVWFNPQLESRHFMIPGVLALVLLVVTANLASMAIVREKELGTLEQLNVTPLRRWELIVGKLLPYGLIGLVDVLLVVAVAVFWFEIPLRGSFALLFLMSVLYVLCTLALGLFIVGVPQAALLTAVVLMLCIAQLGPGLIVIPATIWLFATGATGAGIVMAIFSLAAIVLDNFLRPILIRRGADLPLLLILAGVIGGMLSFGLLGLFLISRNRGSSEKSP